MSVRVEMPVVVGRLAVRRLLYALAVLRSEGIDIQSEVISKGLLDVHYMLAFTGTSEQGGRVDEVLARV